MKPVEEFPRESSYSNKRDIWVVAKNTDRDVLPCEVAEYDEDLMCLAPVTHSKDSVSSGGAMRGGGPGAGGSMSGIGHFHD